MVGTFKCKKCQGIFEDDLKYFSSFSKYSYTLVGKCPYCNELNLVHRIRPVQNESAKKE